LARYLFLANEKEAMAAMARRWASTRYVQDMWKLLAKLEGELSKDAEENAHRVSLVILNNQGRGRLDPEIFREAARRKALEMCSSSPRSSSPRLDPWTSRRSPCRSPAGRSASMK
jgi:hypothetical protein